MMLRHLPHRIRCTHFVVNMAIVHAMNPISFVHRAVSVVLLHSNRLAIQTERCDYVDLQLVANDLIPIRLNHDKSLPLAFHANSNHFDLCPLFVVAKIYLFENYPKLNERFEQLVDVFTEIHLIVQHEIKM